MPPVTDQPPLTLPLPSFSQPRRPPRDPALPEDENQLLPDPLRAGGESPARPIPDSGDAPSRPAPERPSQDAGHRSIRTFSRGEAEAAGKLIGGLVLIAAGLVGWSLRQRNRDLRRPDSLELEAFALPLGRILCRHFDTGMLTPDLADAVESATAASEYVMTTPVTHGARVDHTGIPTYDPED